MPELIDTPVTMADFPEVIPAARSLFLAVVGAGGVEGLVRIEDALQLLEVGDFPDISSLVDDAIAAKADKATPFVNVASAATINLGAAASTSVNITGMTGPVSSFGTTAPEGAEYLLRWNGAVTIANGANLITGTGADLTTYSGMYMLVKKDASNVWRLIWWSRRLLATGGGTSQLTFNLSALSTGRIIAMPDRNIDLNTLGVTQSSGQLTVTAGGLLQFTHTLGAAPSRVSVDLVCIGAELGWAVGDVIKDVGFNCYVSGSTTSNPNGPTRYIDPAANPNTVVNIRWGSSASSILTWANKTTGAAANLSYANWRAVINVSL